MNANCPSCGTPLSRFNCSMLLCRGCAKEYDFQRRIADDSWREIGMSRFRARDREVAIAGSLEEKLEIALLRIEHNWRDTQKQYRVWGKLPSRSRCLANVVVAGMVLWAGISSLVASSQPDILSLLLIASGLVWPVHSVVKYSNYRRAESDYELDRDNVATKLALSAMSTVAPAASVTSAVSP